MAYHTPELLLVGAAQNLVLGVTKSILGFAGNHDFNDEGYSTVETRPDSASW